MNLPSSPHRPIRSFVRREGRFTEAQRRAVEAPLPDTLGAPIPRLSEPWYCCAEPTDEQLQGF